MASSVYETVVTSYPYGGSGVAYTATVVVQDSTTISVDPIPSSLFTSAYPGSPYPFASSALSTTSGVSSSTTATTIPSAGSQSSPSVDASSSSTSSSIISVSKSGESSTTTATASEDKGDKTTVPVSITLQSLETAGALVTGVAVLPLPKAKGALSSGAGAGIGIGCAVIGILIGALIYMMVSKGRRSHKPMQHDESAIFTSSIAKDEKAGAHTSVQAEGGFDLDRLLPQPLDDNGIRREAEKLFSQIDAHVDNFYVASAVNIPSHHDSDTAKALQQPGSRFFMLKRMICQDLLDSISPKCTSERSLLPRGYTSVARMLREPDVDDRATMLSWSRFRTSLMFLMRQDSSSDQDRQSSAVSTLLTKFNHDLGILSNPHTSEARMKDLEAILREGAVFGRTLLAQPAEWRFEWTPQVKNSDGSLVAGSRTGLVYFPALVRLTDNKALKLQTPRRALQARYMH